MQSAIKRLSTSLAWLCAGNGSIKLALSEVYSVTHARNAHIRLRQ
jgi:hypothetical protein